MNEIRNGIASFARQRIHRHRLPFQSYFVGIVVCLTKQEFVPGGEQASFWTNHFHLFHAVWPVPRGLQDGGGIGIIQHNRRVVVHAIMLLRLQFFRSGINTCGPPLQPQRPFSPVATKIDNCPSAVFFRIVEPIRKLFRDSNFLGARMPILDDNSLYGPYFARSNPLKQCRCRRRPGIPVIHHQFNSGALRQTLHLASVCSVYRHRFFRRKMNMTLCAFPQDFKMPRIVCCRDHGIRLHFIQHLHVI